MPEWTQPVCEARFRELNPDREPVRIHGIPDDELDRCCFCGAPTTIYIRIDPATVPHPRET